MCYEGIYIMLNLQQTLHYPVDDLIPSIDASWVIPPDITWDPDTTFPEIQDDEWPCSDDSMVLDILDAEWFWSDDNILLEIQPMVAGMACVLGVIAVVEHFEIQRWMEDMVMTSSSDLEHFLDIATTATVQNLEMESLIEDAETVSSSGPAEADVPEVEMISSPELADIPGEAVPVADTETEMQPSPPVDDESTYGKSTSDADVTVMEQQEPVSTSDFDDIPSPTPE